MYAILVCAALTNEQIMYLMMAHSWVLAFPPQCSAIKLFFSVFFKHQLFFTGRKFDPLNGKDSNLLIVQHCTLRYFVFLERVTLLRVFETCDFTLCRRVTTLRCQSCSRRQVEEDRTSRDLDEVAAAAECPGRHQSIPTPDPSARLVAAVWQTSLKETSAKLVTS